ncbi:MAG: HEAT repeat domain-containing protein [Planctomycetes bacterium]|nr:HEAT repeat domain-containing protein [Planctomycetota bacterium]
MGLAETLGLIRQLPREEAVGYLEAALVEPYEEIQLAAFRFLADQQGINRADVVVQNFPLLLAGVRKRIVEQKWYFIGVAKEQIRSGLERTRRAAYDMLAAIGEVDVAHLLAVAVNDASTVIRDNAASALEKIALRYHYHLLNWHTKEDEKSKAYVESNRALMLQALEVLLRTFQIHRKSLFLEIAVEMGGFSYRLIVDQVLAKTDSPLWRAFLQCMGKAQSDAAVELLFKLLAEREERIREAAVEVMRSRQDAAFPIAVASWLAKLPPDRFLQVSTRVHEIPWWKTVEQNPDIEPLVASKLIDFVARSFIDPRARDAMILTLYRSRHAEVRAGVLLTLREIKAPQALDLARQALADPSDDVRVLAAKAIAEESPPDKAKLLAPLMSSPNEELRKIAVREVSRESFNRYIKSFDRLDDRTRELAAKALAKIDASMMERLVDEVNSMDPERRIKALRIIDYVEAGENLKPLLMELLGDKDTRVRATAIKLIELSGNVEGMKILIGALNDSDRRVRANAIEAFEAIGDERYAALLLPFVKDPDNRVRANAAKALWNLGRHEARTVVEEMLEDPDENMRLSAVWTIGELRYEGAVEVLSSRMTRETSEKVKAKLTDVLARLTVPPGKGEA